MINLNSVTLVAIDTDPLCIPMTRAAALETLKIIRPHEFVFFGVEPLLIGENFYRINRFESINEYSKFTLKCLWPFVKTDHLMIIHWDGFPTDENYWSNQFLNYDYIGAPWIWSINGHNVGNGGFSIRSNKLINLCSHENVQQDLNFLGGAEDVMIGIKYRDYFEKNGCKFPSSELASRFSYELGERFVGSFGFHSVKNIPLFTSEEYLISNVSHLANKLKSSSSLEEFISSVKYMEYRNFLTLFMAQL